MDVSSAYPSLSFMRVMRKLAGFARPHWKVISIGLVMMIGKAAASLLKPWPLKFAIDLVEDRADAGTLDSAALQTLGLLLVLVLGVAAFEGFFTYCQALYVNRAGRTIVFDVRAALLDKLQRLSLQFHNRRQTGDVLTRVTSDVKALKGVLTGSLLELVLAVTTLVGMSVVLLWMDWQLALVPIVAAPFLFLFLARQAREIREHSREQRRSEGALASILHESLGSVRLTRAFNREDAVREKFLEESAANLESGVAATLAEERVTWGQDILWSFVTAGVLGFGVYRVVQGEASVGDLVVFVAYVRNFYKPLRLMLKHGNRINKVAPQAERVVELLETEPGVQDEPDAVRAPRLRGHIEFRGVHFEYEPGRPVLRGIDLDVPAGRVTAIVGPTGCGKTTLTSMLLRLFDPTEGSVLIDGHDVREFTLRSLRSQISTVQQESILFRASIAENIAYGGVDVSTDGVVAAARAAGAHRFIEKLPEGYDTEVGERGDTLSGGQRQRIAIARALVRDAPILILDEPLAGLDVVSAAEVLEGLRALVRGRTVLLITHQPSSLELADEVVVMRAGGIAGRGDVAELADVQRLEQYLRGELALWRA